MGGYLGPATMQGVEGLLSSLVGGIDHGLVLVDADLRLVVANDPWRKMMHLDEDCARPGQSWIAIAEHRLRRDLQAGTERGALDLRLTEVRERARNSLSSHLSYRLHLSDGAVIEAQSHPVVLPDGGAWQAGPGFVRTFSDVTRLLNKETALTLSCDRYELALQSLNEGVFDWDIGSNTIFFSQRLRDLFSLPAAYLRPEDWSRRILADDLPLYRETHRAHLKGQTDRFICEYRMRSGDDRIVWVRQHGIAQRDAMGRAMRFTGSVSDVTEYRQATEDLQRSEERYAVAMQALNEGVYEWRVKEGQVLVSPRLRELFGLPCERLASDDWVERVHPADRTRFLAAQRTLLTGQVTRLEMEYRLRGDSPQSSGDPWRWVLHRGIAIRDDTGRVDRVIGSAGDVTDRKVAEQALQASQQDLARERELLMATLENMDQGIFMATGQGRLVAYNHRLCLMLGLQEGDLFLGISLDELYQRLRQKASATFPADEATRTSFVGAATGETVNRCEVRLLSGQVLEARTVPLADGSFVRTYTDVTAQKIAESRIRDLLERIPLPLVVTAMADNRILYANESAQESFSVHIGQSSVKTAYVDPADRDRMVARLQEQGSVRGFETRLINAEGREEWAMLSASRLVYDGQVAILVATTVITERKTLEQDLQAAKIRAEKALKDLQDTQQILIEAEKMASLGGLVAGVAHEINTPVGITLTTASHLQEKVVMLRRSFAAGTIRKADFAGFLDVAETACDLLLSNCTRAANLIQSFKQVAVDQASEEWRSFDLAGYIDEVLLSLGPKLKRTGHRIDVSCPADILMASFPGPLSQVLTNLVMNALHHGFRETDQGLIRIGVSLPSEDGMIRLCFADNGIGIPAENLKRIFDPFFTTRRGQGGSGLGLNIVYNLMTQSLRGSIRVDSTVGQGTTFALCFPQCLPRPEAG